MSRELAHAVYRSVIEPASAMGLRLQPDTDVLDRAGKTRVRYTGKSARGVVLPIRQFMRVVLERVLRFERPSSVMKCTKLDGNL